VPSSTARVAVSLGGSTVSGVQRGALHGVRVLPNAQGQWASTSWHGHATGINADAPLAVCSLVCVCVCVRHGGLSAWVCSVLVLCSVTTVSVFRHQLAASGVCVHVCVMFV
jgi:hypothetical protein